MASFFSGSAAIAQSVVSSVLVLMACAVSVGDYAWARGSWTAACFAAVAFLLLAVELTMVIMLPHTSLPCGLSALLSSVHLVACHHALFGVHDAYLTVSGLCLHHITDPLVLRLSQFCH